MKVIIDTNAFMGSFQFGLDIFKELERLGYKECIVPSSVIRELNALKKLSRGKDKLAANASVTLASRCTQVITEGPADDAIIELALEQGAAVFTNDAELKKRLSENDIKIVHLRGKDHLEIM